MNKTQKRICELLKREPRTYLQIATALGIKRHSVEKQLDPLLANNTVLSTSDGLRYRGSALIASEDW